MACGHCPSQCGLLAHVREGKLVKITGNRNHILGLGAICKKGKAALEYFYHPGRLNYPLKRRGGRGEGKWERIGWDQALDEIAGKLGNIRGRWGAEAVAATSGTYHAADCGIEIRFFNLFGSPNHTGIGFDCATPALAAESLTYGSNPTGLGPPGPGKMRCMVLWGGRPSASNPALWRAIRTEKSAGVRLIVVDPILTEEAEKADLWLPLRPGTDGALALGWIHVILQEGLYDREFVERWTAGLDQLRERIEDYPPARVATITGLPSEKIVEGARTFAQNRPGVLFWGLACGQIGRNAFQVERAKAILRALVGDLDVEGGTSLPGPHPSVLSWVDMELHSKMPPEQRRKRLGAERFRLHGEAYELLGKAMKKGWQRDYSVSAIWAAKAHAPTLWRTIITGQPYPIKALLVSYNNALGAYANLSVVYQALKSSNLDLLVVHELFPTPTAQLADYILPACNWLEKSSLNSFWGWHNLVIASEQALPAQYERRSDYDFYRDLGLRLGQEGYWPETLEGLWDEMLKPAGITFQELVQRKEPWLIPPPRYRKHEEIDADTASPRGFATPSGKVELYSSILEQLGYDPLPDYEESAESPLSDPVLARHYPFILITGGTVPEFHHQDHRQVPSLRKARPDPVALIHPETARPLGIASGDWVFIESPRGRVRQKAELTDRIGPGVVQSDRWWYPEERGEEPLLHGVLSSNINVCTDDEPDNCDPFCGTWQYRALLCKVYKVERAGGGKIWNDFSKGPEETG